MNLRHWYQVVVNLSRLVVVVRHIIRVIHHGNGLVFKPWAIVKGVSVYFLVLDTVD